MSTEAKEPGQRAYEAWLGPRHGSAWLELDDDGRRSWEAVEQACAVPAPAVVPPETTGGGKAPSVAEAPLHGALAYLTAEVAQYQNPERAPSRIKRAKELLEGWVAEAGKAQAEGLVSVEERLPKPFELVQFATPESAGPTLGKFNGARWMSLFDLSRPGLVDYGLGQVTHWRKLPAPPTSGGNNAE